MFSILYGPVRRAELAIVTSACRVVIMSTNSTRVNQVMSSDGEDVEMLLARYSARMTEQELSALLGDDDADDVTVQQQQQQQHYSTNTASSSSSSSPHCVSHLTGKLD